MTAAQQGLGKVNAKAARLLSLTTAVALILALTSSSLAADDVYRIGPGDELSITVYGEQQLSGRFKVGIDGSISYPLLGTVAAAASTLPDLRDRLRTELIERTPSGRTLTLEVARYAPLFVTGDVEKPGPQEFQPGMIVTELVALAGGLRRARPENAGLVAQSITAKQDYRDLRLQRFSQEVERTRLIAEISGQPFDKAVTAAAGDLPAEAAQRIVDDEAALFATRAQALKAMQTSLRDQYNAFGDEIATLEKSIVLHDQELALLQQEVDTQTGLVDKGLSTQPKLLDLRREFSATRRNALDLNAALARARQQQLAISQKIAETAELRAGENAVTLRELDLAIGRTEQQIEAARSMIAELGARVDELALDRNSRTVYRVIRRVDGRFTAREVDELETLAPGDILKIETGVSTAADLASQQ